LIDWLWLWLADEFGVWQTFFSTLFSDIFDDNNLTRMFFSYNEVSIDWIDLCSSIFDTRVARWFVFKPKIPIWVNFGEPWIGNVIYFIATWNILWKFWIFYDHLVHFVFIWYIFAGFGIMYIPRKIGQP
jgi:hypothetical protein